MILREQEDAFRTGQLARRPSAGALAGANSGGSSDALASAAAPSNSTPDFQGARGSGGGSLNRPARCAPS